MVLLTTAVHSSIFPTFAIESTGEINRMLMGAEWLYLKFRGTHLCTATPELQQKHSIRNISMCFKTFFFFDKIVSDANTPARAMFTWLPVSPNCVPCPIVL